MKIIAPKNNDAKPIQPAAQSLAEAFRGPWPEAGSTLDEPVTEIHEMLEAVTICRAAIDESENLPGIIGGIPQYNGNVWKMHPLAVQPNMQGKGIGKALVKDFEEQVRQLGGLTITLGSDDEDNMTSLSIVDLYENFWEKVKNISNLKRHPFEFYQKMGFIITGVVIDANRRGKPDIVMPRKVKQ